MSGLSDIGVRVEAAGGSENAVPILHEIRHALARLVASGERTVIDLQAIPFGPGDEERLLERLGSGEVTATIDALGPTRVRETAYSGVWVVDYRDTEDTRIGLQIECRVDGLVVEPFAGFSRIKLPVALMIDQWLTPADRWQPELQA